MELAETDLKDYGFVTSGLITMRSILQEVHNQQALLNLIVGSFYLCHYIVLICESILLYMSSFL